MNDRAKVYTDGSSSLKTGLCGWSAIVRYGGQELRRCGWAKGTNQFAELYAIIYVLRRLPKHVPVTIYSDSEYSIKSLTEWRDKWVRNGFRNVQGLPVAYSKLVREGHYLVDSFTDLALVHVRGHTGLEGNEAADKLAKTARYLAEGRSSDKYPAQLEGLVMVDGIDPDTGDVHKR